MSRAEFFPSLTNPEIVSGRALPEILALAAKFSELLRAELGPQTMAAVNALNIKDGKPVENGCCASGDYCDSNTVMDVAWQALCGYEIDHSSQSHGDRWNDSWDIARRSHFNPEACRNYFGDNKP